MLLDLVGSFLESKPVMRVPLDIAIFIKAIMLPPFFALLTFLLFDRFVGKMLKIHFNHMKMNTFDIFCMCTSETNALRSYFAAEFVSSPLVIF